MAIDGSIVSEPILHQLSQTEISWNRVVVVLQRYDINDDQTICPNALNIRDMLLCNNAKTATFIPSQYEKIAASDVAGIMSADIEPLLPIDVVLGKSNVNELALQDCLKGEWEYRSELFSSTPNRNKSAFRCTLSEAALIGAHATIIFSNSADAGTEI